MIWHPIQYLQRKKFWRSQRMGTSIVTRILMGLMLLYFSLIFAALGFFFGEILEDSGLKENPIFILHKYIFYYLLFELVIRIMFQEVSEVQFRQLSLMPLKKSSIVHYILGGSVFSFFNLAPLIFLIPVTIKTIAPEFGALGATFWVVSIFILLLFNNYFSLQLKHWTANIPWLYVVIAACAGGIYLLDLATGSALSQFFHQFMLWILTLLFPIILIILMAYGAYMLDHRRMLGQAYISGSALRSGSVLEKLNFEGLARHGFFGNIVQLNLHMMLRNKRIRTQVIMSFMILVAGLFFFTSDAYDGIGWHLFWGFYMTGIIPLSLVQYIWSYQGDYIELLWTLPMSLENYLTSQYYFYIMAALATAIPASFYYFLDPSLPKIFLVCFLYNIGILIPFLMFVAPYNRKKLDINTSGTFNYQGIKGRQFVFIIGILVTPIIIFSPFHVWGFTHIGLMVVGGMGALGLLLHKILIKLIVSFTEEKKYALTEGYRSN